MQPKHSAIVAGLTLALSFGAVSAPAPAAAEEPTPGVASDATDIDKGLYTQQSFSGVLRSVQGVSFVNVTPEMKYFTKYESHGNYNQGFSYGDGYNALGYYQFDRRWSLIPFMKQAYNYNPEKYCMLKDAIDRGSEISNTSNAMYENGQLTELGRIAQEAFQGAHNIDPAEFSALQDAYAYNSYYAVTEAWLKSGLGIDISGRADCVKGMVWSITNMCGTGGCRDFFRWANLSNDMSDREFVTALSNSLVNNVATKYASQPQYHEGWKNRYRNELKDCLVYIAEDEAAAAKDNKPEQPEPTPAPSPTPDSNDDSSDDANDDRMDAPSTDADGNGSAGGTTNDGSTSNGSDSNGSAAGDLPSSSAGNTDSDASGSTGADTSNSSTGSSDSSVDTGSNNGSGSDTTPDSDASKDDSNKAPDAPVASPDKKPSFSEQLGSTLGSSLMAGVNNGSAQNKDNSDQVSTEKTEAAKGDSKDKASEKTESDKGSSSEEKDDKSAQKKDESKTEGEKKQPEDDDKSGADNQAQEQNDSKTVTTTTTTTTTTKSSGGNMPKTGDLIVMASLASASLATLGATSIVSGKHKLDQQKKASGEDGSEE
ncbi:hypothetical protein ABG977_06120 [Collinsella aerofaciens]|uniref:VgrG-related protein n=2 Tax=Collinsella aerofaciens TaxID=74426 RepID=UPI00325ABE02